MHAKPMLLVRHNKADVIKLYIALNQGMCACYRNNLTVFNAVQNANAFFLGCFPCQECAFFSEVSLKLNIMLFGKDFCRHHQNGLASVFHRNIHCVQCKHRLSRTDVPLNQTVHRAGSGHIVFQFIHNTALCGSQFKRKLRNELIANAACFKCNATFSAALLSKHLQYNRKHQRIFKSKPAPRLSKLFRIMRKMHGMYCMLKRNEIEFRQNTARQVLLHHAGAAGIKCCTDSISDNTLCQPANKRIHRKHAGQRLRKHCAHKSCAMLFVHKTKDVSSGFARYVSLHKALIEPYRCHISRRIAD